MIRLPATFIILGLSLCAIPSVCADDAKAEKTAEKKSNGESPAAATFSVEKKPLKIEVQVEGVFETSEMREVAVETDEWSQLVVEWAVDHGAHVKKGAPLVRFETRKIDIALADMESELESAKLAMQNSEAALKLLEKSVPESLAAARRGAKEAAENLERFRTSVRADMIRDSEEQLQSAERSLSYQLEELNQLERMYKADDITEETEEIVLVRARHRVEAFEYQLERQKKAKERFDKVSLPRFTADIEQAATNSKLQLQKAEDALPASLVEARLGLERMRTSLRRNKKKLSRLRRDRDELTVVASTDGVVYYGQAALGKFPSASSVAKLLTAGGMVKPRQVVMTIVKNEDLFVRSSVDEKDLHRVNRGSVVTVSPTAFPEMKLKGRLDRLSAIPVAPGKFEVIADVDVPNKVKPGMACKMAILVVEKHEAIMVPASAVKVKDNGEKGYVYVVDGDDKRKTNVRVGHRDGEQLEILSGLKVGDKVLTKNTD